MLTVAKALVPPSRCIGGPSQQTQQIDAVKALDEQIKLGGGLKKILTVVLTDVVQPDAVTGISDLLAPLVFVHV